MKQTYSKYTCMYDVCSKFVSCLIPSRLLDASSSKWGISNWQLSQMEKSNSLIIIFLMEEREKRWYPVYTRTQREREREVYLPYQSQPVQKQFHTTAGCQKGKLHHSWPPMITITNNCKQYNKNNNNKQKDIRIMQPKWLLKSAQSRYCKL